MKECVSLTVQGLSGENRLRKGWLEGDLIGRVGGYFDYYGGFVMEIKCWTTWKGTTRMFYWLTMW